MCKADCDRGVTPCSLAALAMWMFCGGVAAAQSATADEGAQGPRDEVIVGADSGDPLEDFGATQRGPKDAPAAEAESQEDRDLHFKIMVDWTSAYYFRGIRQEDRGFIMQPAGELGVDLIEEDSFTLGAFFGIWNSFHDRATGSIENEDIVDKWYEADLYAGAGGSIGKVGYSVTYIAYTSPSDAFETIDEIVFSVNYNDSEWWGESGFSLTPSLSFGWEVGSNFADGADTERGLYLQPGVTPAFKWSDAPLVGEIGFSFPVTVGLSIDDYYENGAGEDETFGFLSISAKAAIPLPVPASYGAWTLNGGIQFLALGDTTSEFNDDEDTVWIGTLGLSIAF